MPERVANIIVLCEDQEQQNLIRRYLGCLNLKNLSQKNPRYLSTLGKDGCGSQYVRKQFPKQVAMCRGTLGKKTKCLLIVMTDADNLTVKSREQTLYGELKSVNLTAVTNDEPIVILIPKWQIETWIKCLLGIPMREDDQFSDRPPVQPDQIKTAAVTLFDWTRPNAQIGVTFVPSLRSALPRWLRIG